MTTGIHHITAIASDAVKTFHFYTEILGLRLVKRTVNQDDVRTYHLFFGDEAGHPGMDLTFFIFQPATQGFRGNGLVTTISLAVPEVSLPFWQERFKQYQVKHRTITERFGRKRILFFDQDNQQLELVGVPQTELEDGEPWVTAEVSRNHAIRSFYSATLSVHQQEVMELILNHVFGYQYDQTAGKSHQYSLVGKGNRAHILELVVDPTVEVGLNAAGTVHHIAFRAKDEAEQLKLRSRVVELGLYPTTVIDRFYFKSVYFRVPAGILFEIATDGPGFVADEATEHLGQKLALPPFLEPQRKDIEANLPKLEI